MTYAPQQVTQPHRRRRLLATAAVTMMLAAGAVIPFALPGPALAVGAAPTRAAATPQPLATTAPTQAETLNELVLERAGCQAKLDSATTNSARDRARTCIADDTRAITWILNHPSPTPTPTVGPTTPPPTTPPATPSPTPTPSPTGPVLNCMPLPSRCGWPDATNTGVPAGTVLQVVNGDMTFLAGGTYQNLDIRGCTQVGGSNVTIRRVKITCAGALPIDIEDRPSITGVFIEDVEIDSTGQFSGRGIAGGGFTARRIWWHGGSDCSHFNSNVVIEDSYCNIPHFTGSGDPHLDGFQSGGGAHVTLRHNTIRNANGQTSAIINGPDLGVLGPQTDVHIVGNLMSGGDFVVYCQAHPAPQPSTAEFRDNRISREFWPLGGQFGPITDCVGIPGVESTVWDDTGLPVTPQ